jgi:hypothetical protein
VLANAAIWDRRLKSRLRKRAGREREGSTVTGSFHLENRTGTPLNRCRRVGSIFLDLSRAAGAHLARFIDGTFLRCRGARWQ